MSREKRREREHTRKRLRDMIGLDLIIKLEKETHKQTSVGERPRMFFFEFFSLLAFFSQTLIKSKT